MVADPLISQGPTVVRRLASLYSPVIQRSRAAWGAVYHSSNTKPTFAAIRAVFGPGVRKVIVELIKKHDPDVVLSVHPLLNQISHQAIQRCGRPRGLMTVITDLVDFHRGWTFSQADLVIAPTEVARKVAIRRRVPHERVKLLGLPVDMRFRPPAPGEKQALRRRFGLDEARFTVLVMGGAAGVGGLLNQVRVLGWEPHQWQVIAVCGRNEKLRRRLARLRFATPTLVLGFVDNMPEVMRACDVTIPQAVLATINPPAILITGREMPKNWRTNRPKKRNVTRMTNTHRPVLKAVRRRSWRVRDALPGYTAGAGGSHAVGHGGRQRGRLMRPA